jgi:hypothetical protein
VWNGEWNPEWNAFYASDVSVEKCGNYWYNEETAKLSQFLNDLFGVSKPCRVVPVRLEFIKRKIRGLAKMRSPPKVSKVP